MRAISLTEVAIRDPTESAGFRQLPFGSMNILLCKCRRPCEWPLDEPNGRNVHEVSGKDSMFGMMGDEEVLHN